MLRVNCDFISFVGLSTYMPVDAREPVDSNDGLLPVAAHVRAIPES